MGINATIEEVIEYDGKIKLVLSSSSGNAGQKVITILNPPLNIKAFMKSMVGIHIWGNGNRIMIDKTEWAIRKGYTMIEIIDRKKTQ